MFGHGHDYKVGVCFDGVVAECLLETRRRCVISPWYQARFPFRRATRLAFSSRVIGRFPISIKCKSLTRSPRALFSRFVEMDAV